MTSTVKSRTSVEDVSETITETVSVPTSSLSGIQTNRFGMSSENPNVESEEINS